MEGSGQRVEWMRGKDGKAGVAEEELGRKVHIHETPSKGFPSDFKSIVRQGMHGNLAVVSLR